MILSRSQEDYILVCYQGKLVMFLPMLNRGNFLISPRRRGFLIFLFLLGVCSVLIGAAVAPSYGFQRLSNKMTSIKAQTKADHIIQFTTSQTIATSSISVNFANVVSSTNTVDYESIRLMYGPDGSEAEYPVAAAAGDGIWGAALDQNTKLLTLSYPTARGVPIQAGWRGVVLVGVDPTPNFPFSTTSTLDLPTIRQQQLQVQQQQQVQQLEVPTEQIVVEGQPQNQQRPGEQAPAEVAVDFGRVREFIRDQLSRIRTVVQRAQPPAASSAPVPPPQVIAPQQTPITQQQEEQQRQEQQRLERERQIAAGEVPSIVLPAEKTANVNPERETSLLLRRNDGAGIDVFLPQQATLGQGSAARYDTVRLGSVSEVYTVNVKPVTLEQAKVWSSLEAPQDKRIAPAQVYIVTAYKESEEGVDPIQQFLNPITYVFRFTEEEIQGIEKGSLEGYSYDGTTMRKERSVIDTENNTVTVTSDHMTVFVLAGNKTSAAPFTFVVRSLISLVPVVADISLADFGMQQGSAEQQLYQGERDFSTTPNARVSLCVPRDIFQKPVKRLVLTLADRVAQFTLDSQRSCYATSLVTPSETGSKQMALKVVYVDDQVQLLRYRASILPALQVRLISAVAPQVVAIRKSVEAASKEVKKAVEESQPALQTTAIAAGPVAAALNPGLISSSVNWYHYLNHFISALLSALGLRKRRRPWGVVYDAITKNSIDLAIVRLFDGDKKLIETQVTDKNGRFSFLVKPGNYTLGVSKQEYVFPSAIVKGALDGDYAHVYHQEAFVIARDEDLIEVSIPLDPPHPELIKKTRVGLKGFLHSFSKYSMVSLFLSVGLSVALAVYIPTSMNLILLFLNCLFMLGKVAVISRKEKPWGTVFDALSLESLPLAAIGIIDGKAGKLLRTRLSDYEGRFSFLVPQGEYVFTVSKDQYHFPPQHAPHTRRFKHMYLGGKIAVKRNRGYVKLDVPMERIAESAPPQSVQQTPQGVPEQTYQQPAVEQQKKTRAKASQ